MRCLCLAARPRTNSRGHAPGINFVVFVCCHSKLGTPTRRKSESRAPESGQRGDNGAAAGGGGRLHVRGGERSRRLPGAVQPEWHVLAQRRVPVRYAVDWRELWRAGAAGGKRDAAARRGHLRLQPCLQ